MELQTRQLHIPFEAGLDLSSWQHRFVRISGVLAVRTLTLRGTVHGVLENKPKSGETARVRVFGIGKIVADGSVALGDFLMSDASGRATTATLGSGTGVNVAARAYEADGAAGTKIMALTLPWQGQL